MRLGLLGDIHAEDVRLEAALAHLRAAHMDVVLSVGDVVDGPGDVDRCVRLLMEHGVIGVKGNHDRWIVRGDFIDDVERKRMGWTVRTQLSDASFAWLAALPATRTIATVRGPLLLCHGVGDDDMKRFEPDTPLDESEEMQDVLASKEHRIIVGGHTHLRMARIVDGVFIINPGTLTTRGGTPGFATLELDQGGAPHIAFFDVDDEGTITRGVSFDR
jgi:putative phosphoesterase